VKRRLNGSLIISVAIHAVVATAVLHAILAPRYLEVFFGVRPRAVEAPIERLIFIETPAVTAQVAEAPVAAPVIRPGIVAASPRLVAPQSIPDGVAPPVAGPPMETPLTTGVVGGTGTGDPRGRGSVSVTPAYSDPRIWNTPSPYTPPVKTQAEDLQEYLARGIREALDSAKAASENQRDPRDWTKEIGGQKYGMDSQWIHVGKFKLPTLLLGMLPMQAQANPNAVDRYRRINEMSAEIQERRALMADTDDEIKRINARMDRQREARLRAKKAAATPPEPPGLPD
jgi:hypothetical protein